MRTASGAAAADQVAEASPDPTGTAAQRAAAQAATGAPAGVEPMPGGGIATDDPGPDPDAEFPGPTGPQRGDIGRPVSAPEDPERKDPAPRDPESEPPAWEQPEPESGDPGRRGNDELTTEDATRGA